MKLGDFYQKKSVKLSMGSNIYKEGIPRDAFKNNCEF